MIDRRAVEGSEKQPIHCIVDDIRGDGLAPEFHHVQFGG